MQWTPECKRGFASLVDLGTFSDEGTKMGSWGRAREMLLSSYKAQMYIWYKNRYSIRLRIKISWERSEWGKYPERLLGEE